VGLHGLGIGRAGPRLGLAQLVTDRNLLFDAEFKRENWFFVAIFSLYIPKK